MFFRVGSGWFPLLRRWSDLRWTHLDPRGNGTEGRKKQLLGVIDVSARSGSAIQQRCQNIKQRRQERSIAFEGVHRTSLEDDDETSVEGKEGFGLGLGVLLGSLDGSGRILGRSKTGKNVNGNDGREVDGSDACFDVSNLSLDEGE